MSSKLYGNNRITSEELDLIVANRLRPSDFESLNKESVLWTDEFTVESPINEAERVSRLGGVQLIQMRRRDDVDE